MRSKATRKRPKRATRLTLKAALREVKKKHPGLRRDLQDQMARRNVTLHELTIHSEQYRNESQP